MRLRISSIIALFCIVIYIAALGFTAYQVYVSIKERYDIAEQEFFSLADAVSLAGRSGFMTESFREAVRNAVMQSETLQGLIISGPYGNEYTFERLPGSVIDQTGGVPWFTSRFGIFPKPFFSPLNIEGTRNVTISAVSDYLDYGALVTILKRTLIMVLAALAIAFLTLLIDTLLVKNPGAFPVKSAESGEDAGGIFPPVEAPGPERSGGGEASEENYIDISDLDIPEPDIPDDIPEPEPPAGSSDTAGPQGLYAPHSNIGWEAYTKDRLAAELHRCAAGEQDLVLIIIEITGPGEDELYYQVADAAVKFFTLQDLMFERGSRGISVIIPNMDLDRGFSKAEQFRSRIIGSFPGIFPEKNDLSIGISSRSGRLIDADRLLLEASQALKKAREDPASSIVAFKSDPEKYRAFIASQNKSRP
ncbi:MAG: hypothetical protein LBP93_00880 [Treponema sp.]|jgi:hypothetical protein|nr:hypothetical protein [Treponema sp.]